MTNFEEELQKQLDKLPYEKHVDDGQYNDGQLVGYELGARWAFEQIVLDKLPDSTEIINNCPASSINAREQWFTGVVWMKNRATQRITTREEVEKPFRELLEEIADSETTWIPDELHQRIKELLKR